MGIVDHVFHGGTEMLARRRETAGDGTNIMGLDHLIQHADMVISEI